MARARSALRTFLRGWRSRSRDTGAAARDTGRPVLPLSGRAWIGLLTVSAAAFLVTGLLVHQDRRRSLQEARTTAARLAQVLEEQTLRTVQAVDLTLAGIADAVVLARLRRHDIVFESALRRKRDELPFVRALFVVGPDGFITQDTDHPWTPDVSLADRSYFRTHQQDATIGLHIGPPVISRSVGTWFLSMSRRIDTPGGGFGGLVVAAVDPRYFERLYLKLTLREGDVVTLFRRDGTLLSSAPYRPASIGTSFAETPLFSRQLPRRPSGTHRPTGPLDDVRRIESYRTVEGLPLVVTVGLAEAPALAAWRRTAVIGVVFTALLVALIATVFVLVARHARQRAELQARLVQAQKLEALGRMTGGIAHDFSNVLNIIAANLEVLRQGTAVPGRVDAAIRAVRQGTALAGQLLAFGRRQHLKIESLDANHLVRAVMPLLEQAAGPSVRITTSLAPDLWRCRADEAQFDSAILNLVVNARDAMPQRRGEVRITTENACVTERGPLATLARGDYVCVTVTDDGSGMPPDVLRRATEPFFTTKPVGTGTGLGLSQIYGYLQQLGGDLVIESAVGIGTSVRLYFPRASEPVAR